MRENISIVEASLAKKEGFTKAWPVWPLFQDEERGIPNRFQQIVASTKQGNRIYKRSGYGERHQLHGRFALT